MYNILRLNIHILQIYMLLIIQYLTIVTSSRLVKDRMPCKVFVQRVQLIRSKTITQFLLMQISCTATVL